MESKSVSGVLLAAGESTRFGAEASKPLLSFRGELLVRRVARRLQASGLNELIVVTGWRSEAVAEAVAGLGVTLVENRSWAAGQSTSVVAGLKAVSGDCAAALFCPADQPFVTGRLIDRMLEVYGHTGGAIVLPSFEGRRGSPVLFDRSLFAELSRITGDRGGRQLFPRFSEEIVEVELDEQSALLDLDTPETYRRLLELPDRP